MKLKLLIGKRGTGKSVLVCDILKYNQKKEYICILQGDRLGDNFELYNNFNKCIRGDFEYLEKMYMYGTKIHGIIIDGYTTDRVFKNKTLKKIKMDSDITIIVVLNFLESIPLEFLERVDQIFYFKGIITRISDQDKILFDHVGKFGKFKTFDEFKKVLDSRNNYGCMILDKNGYMVLNKYNLYEPTVLNKDIKQHLFDYTKLHTDLINKTNKLIIHNYNAFGQSHKY